LEGSHEWEIKEALQLVSIRASNDPVRNVQFTVDPSTKESKVDFDYLVRRKAVQFKESLY
jgi:hypothetical protein